MARKGKKKKLDREALERVAKVFAVFGDPTRLAILQELMGGEHSVGELVAEIGLSQGNISKQLQVLFDSGLLTRAKEGNQVFYAIGDDMVLAMCELVCQKLNRDLEGTTALSFEI